MPQNLTELDSLALESDIKVAFFDIDGTLLHNDGHYSERLRREFARIQALGVKTAIASGRPHFAARFLIDELGLTSPGVFCTGAQVYAPLENRTLFSASLPVEVSLRLLSRLRELEIYYELYGYDDFYLETQYAAEVRDIHSHHLRRRPVECALDDVVRHKPMLKWVLGLRRDAKHDLLGMLEAEFPEFNFAYAAFPACADWRFVNVIAKDACKKRVFAWLLDHYQVQPEQVASFGDSHSDETFLRLAGVGVAMGNAPDDVKAAARFVTKTAEEDGVAYALARLF
ncbi:HAD-IIB family hydrolase [Saccharophagus sp. K07]|uniref:HAD-IIB family hydrolase n=1 Tax=Saccharophagus sp. K07 TaxID=2283636 RepID=UPI001651F6E4|nr:HAD-IIB family hydrolase [Saccharophagus sp. K07]MBC6906769.1 HAD-IIB family hydrolase [Saccharophagus sp. K07]